jgi:Lecithin retinol acyltransferase
MQSMRHARQRECKPWQPQTPCGRDSANHTEGNTVHANEPSSDQTPVPGEGEGAGAGAFAGAVRDGGDWAPGTHLVSPRRGYQHHGLYAGGGRVIHYAGFSRLFRRGPIEEVSLARFARGRGVQAQAHAAPAFAGTAAVARARMRLGEDRYRFWTNNCEHLVQWALNGTPRSSQVERWVHGWRRTWSRLAWAVPLPH